MNLNFLHKFGILQLIVALLIFNSIAVTVLISDIQYNRQVQQFNKQQLLQIVNETNDVLNSQLNISEASRQFLLHQLEIIVAHGGFASNETSQQIDDKLDKLLNQTK